MRIGKHNYIKQLKLHNEKALMYVIDEYGGLIMSVIRRHLFALPEQQEECFDDVFGSIFMTLTRVKIHLKTGRLQSPNTVLLIICASISANRKPLILTVR